MKVKLDPNALTFGDLVDFEDAAGVSMMETFSTIDKSGNMADLKMRTLVALVWVCGRQDNPGLTLEDARALRFDDLEIDVGGNGVDPTPGAG